MTAGPWGIGGLSMGGYGAMRLGLKYPDQFASIWSHSSVFQVEDYLDPDLIDGEAIADGSIQHHARTLVESNSRRPVISFDCGVDDELLQHNRELHSFMTEMGIEHHYAEHPGAHTWEYWDEHVREALAQHEKVLGQP